MKVEFTKEARKQILKSPKHCQVKASDWIEQVEEHGLAETRIIPGFHDEPLKGDKAGRRSIRLNRKWRLEYEETEKHVIVTIVEVHPHKY